MKYFIHFLIISILTFSSCQSETSLSPEIGQAEAAYNKEQNPDNLKKLVELYNAYLNENPSSDMRSSVYMKLADLHTKSNRFAAGIESLQQVLRYDYGGKYAPEAAIALGNIYAEKLNNADGASAVFQSFLTAFPDSPRLEEVKAKIPKNAASIDDMMKKLGGARYNDKTNKIDFKVANDFIGMAEVHALMLPKSEASADYLHDAGSTATYQRAFPKAIRLYDWVITKYPNHKQAAISTFMLAYTFDNELKDYGEARKYYEQFLSKYPEHEMAESAKVLLENIGVPDEEIIERLQKK